LARAGLLPGTGARWIERRWGPAGSRRQYPGCKWRRGRGARLIAALEGLDDDHGTAAARTGGAGFGFIGRIVRRWWCDIEQPARAFELILAPCAGEQAIVSDAMKSARQGVEEEAADELVRGERHDLLPFGARLAVILT